MRKLVAGAAIALGAAVACATLAEAADVTPIVVPPPVVVTPPPPTINWAGAYVGSIVGLVSPFDDPALALGGVGGFNFDRGKLVLGAEVQSYAIFFAGIGGGFTNLQIIGLGRVGTAVGAEDRLLLYGAAGLGFYFTVTGGPG